MVAGNPETSVFDDTAIREAEAARKAKKKKTSGRGDFEMVGTTPNPDLPLRVEFPPAPIGYQPGSAQRAVIRERLEEWERQREMGRFMLTAPEDYFPPPSSSLPPPPFMGCAQQNKQLCNCCKIFD